MIGQGGGMRICFECDRRAGPDETRCPCGGSIEVVDYLDHVVPCPGLHGPDEDTEAAP